MVGPPLRVVPVLLASSSVASHRLYVAAVIQADPDLLPGGRDRERTDPGERLGIVDGAAVGRTVVEPSANAPPPDAGRLVAREAQPNPGSSAVLWPRLFAGHGPSRSS